MTDQTTEEAASDQPTPQETAADSGAAGSVQPQLDDEEAVLQAGAPQPPPGREDALSRVLSGLRASNVDAVFGKPYQVGNRTMIPVATLGSMYGFARGRNRQPGVQAHGEGVGGGGRTRARPVAIVVVDETGVTVQPIVDVGRIAFVLILTWGIAGIIRALRR
jgi:uncharacterized spore protein YtfJ